MDIHKITSFELTKRQTLCVMLIIFGVYIIITCIELLEEECSGYRNCFDYDRRMARLYVWDLSWIEDDYRHFVHMGLLELSYYLFENYRILPFLSSIFILIFTYKLVFSITQKRIAGVIAILVTLQSSIFLNYDTSVTYPSFWSLFFIIALYLTRTKLYPLSPAMFLLSVFAKSITILFLPAMLFFILLDKNPKKFLILLLYVVTIIVGVVGLFLLDHNTQNTLLLFNRYDIEQFMLGFVSWIWKGFAHDQLTVVFLIIATSIILMKKIREGIPALVYCYGIILTSPFLIGFSTYDVWPYRFVPLITGISLLVGILSSNIEKWIGSFKIKSIR